MCDQCEEDRAFEQEAADLGEEWRVFLGKSWEDFYEYAGTLDDETDNYPVLESYRKFLGKTQEQFFTTPWDILFRG